MKLLNCIHEIFVAEGDQYHELLIVVFHFESIKIRLSNLIVREMRSPQVAKLLLESG